MPAETAKGHWERAGLVEEAMGCLLSQKKAAVLLRTVCVALSLFSEPKLMLGFLSGH